MTAYHLHDTLGATYIGMVLAASLHGMSCTQAWYYFTHQSDTWPIKSLVSAVILLDTLHQALITHSVYVYTITNWGEPLELEKLIWSIVIEVAVNGLITFLVQSFLAVRVWRLSNGRIVLTAIIALLVVAEFICLLVYTIISFQFQTFVQLARLKFLSVTINVLGVAGDLLIAATLCSILHSSRTGFRRSDTMINKLILFTVNTGLLTSFCAVASLIATTVAPNTFIYITFFFCIGRLYTNCLFATLNSRNTIKRSGEGIQTSLFMSLDDFPQNGSIMRPTDLSIKIDTTKDFITDSDHELNLGQSEVETRNSSNISSNLVKNKGAHQHTASHNGNQHKIDSGAGGPNGRSWDTKSDPLFLHTENHKTTYLPTPASTFQDLKDTKLRPHKQKNMTQSNT